MTQSPISERPAAFVGTLSIVLDGEPRAFIYPEGTDSEACVRRVLAGKEYPLFTDAGWRPTDFALRFSRNPTGAVRMPGARWVGRVSSTP